MANFNEIFDVWADNYDETVYNTQHEYREVFENYEGILEEIVQYINDKRNGITLEIGLGTGNLSKKLAENGHYVVGIEPSKKMREQANNKLTNVVILDGDFLNIPLYNKVDSIVASYAFHHLTLEEKRKALKLMDSLLKESGKIVIADTMFISQRYKEKLIKEVEELKAFNLLNDLKREYYELVEDMVELFKELNYTITLKQMNKYVWIIFAQKKEEFYNG
ncbi:class I SAM-dependent methyltransferase [Anaerobranca gottschalkii]|uniref:Uncharacterized methyltransferase SAMN03080614_101911 n=1 Tax=Anaerobranca gottschalkii DSM 13577 TaxID=1120990 RepID=A0A1I0AAL4_9FIRM|nr:class I SAM-dependent methyltransferase [Anaerobranca gottschalkii]SES91260.1 putative AdoMet-dependent methyltransferase [Anaerobranca gottschalkii DSM 13577]